MAPTQEGSYWIGTRLLKAAANSPARTVPPSSLVVLRPQEGLRTTQWQSNPLCHHSGFMGEYLKQNKENVSKEYKNKYLHVQLYMGGVFGFI